MLLLSDFTGLTYGEVIRLGINPNAIRRMLADVDATEEERDKPPPPSAFPGVPPDMAEGTPPARIDRVKDEV